MGSPYEVKYSTFIAWKYHFSAQSASTTMYMSHLGMILKILTAEICFVKGDDTWVHHFTMQTKHMRMRVWALTQSFRGC